MLVPHLSVEGRVAATTVALLAVTLGGVSAFVVSSTSAAASRSAEALTAETAVIAGGRIAAELERAYGTARDLASSLEGLQATGAGRAQADRVQRTLLEDHPDYLGVWSGWEPGAWDGRDAAHVRTTGSDATGRYIPYWYRDQGAVALAPLTGYTEAGVGDYYQVPLRTGEEKVLDPYEYEVGGETVLMTSLAVPVERAGRVLAVAGVDIALSDVQEQVGGVRVYGTGSATLVSTAGLVVAGPDADAVGQPVPAGVRALVDAASRGTASEDVDGASGQVLRVAAPLRLGAQDT